MLTIVPSNSDGLDRVWFDAFVLRCGIPSRIAGIIYHYIILGLNTSVGEGAAVGAVPEVEATETRDSF